LPDFDCLIFEGLTPSCPLIPPSAQENTEFNMDEAIALLHRLVQQRFYGAITLKFEAGRLVCLKKEETIKPTLHRDNRGTEDARTHNID
jgi:hypothetical protein